MVGSTGISFSGLASGLDTAAIVSQLVALERIPIQVAESQRAEQQTRLDTLGQFRTLVEGLQESAEELSTEEGFLRLATSGANPDVAQVTAASDALQGTHTIDVTRLASVDRWAFDGVTDATANLASADGQSVGFRVGSETFSFAFTANSSSLQGIANRINDEAGEAVSASVVNTGTEQSPQFQLVLAATESGDEARISSITSTVAGLDIDSSPPNGQGIPTSANNLTVGLNALATVDGLPITRTNNDFGDVVPGIAIDLVGLGTTTFGVEPDRDGIRSQIDDFIDSYNDVRTFINTQSTFTPSNDEDEAGTSGPLFGDSVLSSVRAALQRGLFNVPIEDVLADTEGFSTLSNVGITSDNDGLLSIDDDLFNEKLATDLEAFADIFVDTDGFQRDPDAIENTPEFNIDITEDSGLFANLGQELDRLFGSLPTPEGGPSISGIFDLRRDTFQSTIERIDDDVAAQERRIELFEENLILRFARLEELIGQLNSQGSALSASLAG